MTPEVIELMNTGAGPLNMTGAKFTDGIAFTFASGVMDPGQRIVLVKNLSAYISRYSPGAVTAGTFTGALDNSGERLRIVDGMGEEVLDFRYEGTWYPNTHEGSSLVIENDSGVCSAGNSPGRGSAKNGAHWNDITATLNLPNSPPDELDPGPPGAETARRFLQVIKQPTDSNGNGIADWWELQHGFVPSSVLGETGYFGQSSSADSDGDGIPDYVEGRCALNPHSTDSDGNGTGDIMEDSDADGAINQSELLNHSTLWNPDTDDDDDGITDGDDWFELIDPQRWLVTC